MQGGYLQTDIRLRASREHKDPYGEEVEQEQTSATIARSPARTTTGNKEVVKLHLHSNLLMLSRLNF
jgi:hypothetical protein